MHQLKEGLKEEDKFSKVLEHTMTRVPRANQQVPSQATTLTISCRNPNPLTTPKQGHLAQPTPRLLRRLAPCQNFMMPSCHASQMAAQKPAKVAENLARKEK